MYCIVSILSTILKKSIFFKFRTFEIYIFELKQSNKIKLLGKLQNQFIDYVPWYGLGKIQNLRNISPVL